MYEISVTLLFNIVKGKTSLDPLLNLYVILDFDIFNSYAVAYDINVKASLLV